MGIFSLTDTSLPFKDADVFQTLHSKHAGLNLTQRWVKNGQTQRLSYFDPVFGRGVKSREQKVKVLPCVYSTHELS